jgi:hypothetical protein
MMFGFELVLDVSRTDDVINVHTSDYTGSGRHRQPKDSTKQRFSCCFRYSSFVVMRTAIRSDCQWGSQDVGLPLDLRDDADALLHLRAYQRNNSSTQS